MVCLCRIEAAKASQAPDTHIVPVLSDGRLPAAPPSARQVAIAQQSACQTTQGQALPYAVSSQAVADEASAQVATGQSVQSQLATAPPLPQEQPPPLPVSSTTSSVAEPDRRRRRFHGSPPRDAAPAVPPRPAVRQTHSERPTPLLPHSKEPPPPPLPPQPRVPYHTSASEFQAQSDTGPPLPPPPPPPPPSSTEPPSFSRAGVPRLASAPSLQQAPLQASGGANGTQTAAYGLCRGAPVAFTAAGRGTGGLAAAAQSRVRPGQAQRGAVVSMFGPESSDDEVT